MEYHCLSEDVDSYSATSIRSHLDVERGLEFFDQQGLLGQDVSIVALLNHGETATDVLVILTSITFKYVVKYRGP